MRLPLMLDQTRQAASWIVGALVTGAAITAAVAAQVALGLQVAQEFFDHRTALSAVIGWELFMVILVVQGSRARQAKTLASDREYHAAPFPHRYALFFTGSANLAVSLVGAHSLLMEQGSQVAALISFLVREEQLPTALLILAALIALLTRLAVGASLTLAHPFLMQHLERNLRRAAIRRDFTAQVDHEIEKDRAVRRRIRTAARDTVKAAQSDAAQAMGSTRRLADINN